MYTIPKYTQYQLSSIVREEIKRKDLSVRDASLKYEVNQNLLEDIIQGKIKFKKKHYEVVSSILRTPISDLLADEEIKPISFRSKHEKDDQYVNREIEKISTFFVEVAMLRKLHGRINVEN